MSRMTVSASFLCSVFLGVLLSAQSGTDKAAVQKQIVQNEKAIMEAILKNDPKTFHSLVVPDSLAVGGEGIVKVADLDVMMKNMQANCKTTKWDLAESKFSWLNERTVVHIFKETTDRTCGGQRDDAPLWSSTVWVNKDGKWLGGFHQESVLIAPPAQK